MTFDDILRKQIEETGRPLHPTFAKVLDGWIDPTAREKFVPGELSEDRTIDVRERTITSVSMYYASEGLTGALTPLAMILKADAMLCATGLSDDELKNGFGPLTAADLDPWGEVAALPDDVREELGRASWHVAEALKKLGII